MIKHSLKLVITKTLKILEKYLTYPNIKPIVFVMIHRVYVGGKVKIYGFNQ